MTAPDYDKAERWLLGLAERQVTANGSRATFVSDMYFEAAESISSLRAQLAEARELLKPFSNWCDFVESHWRSVGDQTIVSGDTRSAVVVGDLRRAREFLEKTK